MIYCSVAPATTALAGSRLAKRFQLPLVIDIRDPWSYGPSRPYRHYVDFLLERRLERKTLAHADLVVTPSHTARRLLLDQVGVPSEKTCVIPNGYESVDGAETGPLEDGVFTILHAGEISTPPVKRTPASRRIKPWLGLDFDPLHRDFESRSPICALEALDMLFRRRPELRCRIRLRFVGARVDETSLLVRQYGCADRVTVESRVASDQAERMILSADALLLLQVSYWLGGRPFCPAIPAKLYSYLRAGKPVIAVTQRSEISELIEDARAGWVIEPMDAEGLAIAFEKAVDGWLHGNTGTRDWKGRFEHTRHVLAGKLAAHLRRLASCEAGIQ